MHWPMCESDTQEAFFRPQRKVRFQNFYLESPVALWAPLDPICEPLPLSCSCSFLLLSYVSKLLPELGDFLMQTPVEGLQLSEAIYCAVLSNLHPNLQVHMMWSRFGTTCKQVVITQNGLNTSAIDREFSLRQPHNAISRTHLMAVCSCIRYRIKICSVL